MRKLPLLFLFIWVSFLGQSQDSMLVTSDIQKLTDIYSQYNARYQTFNQKNSGDISVLKLISKNNLKADTSRWNQTLSEEKIKLLKREIGLNGNIAYQENLTPNVGEPEENLIYNRRIQLGVEWDFLKNGFTDNYFDRKALEEQLTYDRYADGTSSSSPYFLKKMNEIITLFNLRKIDILDSRHDFINLEDSIAKNLFLLKQIKHEDYIKIQSRRAEILGMKSIYTSYNKYSSSQIDTLIGMPLPLIDLNYSFLASLLNESDTALINQFDWEKIADLKNKWWNEISGKVYFRYNLYDLAQDNPSTRSFFSLGLNLKIPLIFNHKYKKNIEYIKYQKHYQSLKDVKSHQKEEILNLVYEYRYRLKQYINTYQKKLLFQELLRKEEVKLDFADADFNPIKGIGLVDDILKIDIELHDLLQNLYIKALRINEKLKNASNSEEEFKIENLVYHFELPQINIEENKMSKGIFIWSKIVDSSGIEFLKQYLNYNKYDQLFLAAKQTDPSLKKKKTLLKSFKGERYLMIGNNNLIHSNQPNTYVENIVKTYESDCFDGIHLDVEPHTFDDWKQNKPKYQLEYLNMVRWVKSFCDKKGKKLSLSIPLHYDSVLVKELLKASDYIEFMAYENIKPSYILKKIAPYKENFNQIGISLRTEDFKNKIELQQFAIEISKLTGIERINFHSLKRLVKMDEEHLNLK